MPDSYNFISIYQTCLPDECWLIAFIVFVSDVELLVFLLLYDIDDDVDVSVIVLLFELFGVLLLIEVLALLALFALLLFRVARWFARKEMRRFKSSRSSDFRGETCSGLNKGNLALNSILFFHP